MTSTAALDELRDRYLEAQLAGNRREAVRLVVEDGLGSGADVHAVQAAVVQAAQVEIGRLWQENRVTIAQEHMATAISQLALAALFERVPAAPRHERALLLACVEGELHDLPARLAADVLELDGFDVVYLGANVPDRELVEATRAVRPDVVGLSVTMTFNVPALRAAVAGLRALGGTPIFVGGHALRWSSGLAAELDVEPGGAAPDEIVAIARRLAKVG